MAYHGKTTLGLNSILLARSKVKKGLITSLSQAVDDFRHHSHKDLGRISEEKRFCGTVDTSYQGDIWELYQNGAQSARQGKREGKTCKQRLEWWNRNRNQLGEEMLFRCRCKLRMPQKHWKKSNPRTKKCFKKVQMMQKKHTIQFEKL
ncbi:uncharacterized protein [Pocillopora verrucosa]|uniref:uncharacterized protein n=1 Tax=Pocillopora verrucosa TaxID=203993 RepID=UPI0033413F3E